MFKAAEEAAQEINARDRYCPVSMASPAGPRPCSGSECLAWNECRTKYLVNI